MYSLIPESCKGWHRRFAESSSQGLRLGVLIGGRARLAQKLCSCATMTRSTRCCVAMTRAMWCCARCEGRAVLCITLCVSLRTWLLFFVSFPHVFVLARAAQGRYMTLHVVAGEGERARGRERERAPSSLNPQPSNLLQCSWILEV